MKKLFHCLMLALALAAAPAWSQAPGYPDKSRPLRILLTGGAGSASDLLTRALAKVITDTTGQPVVVENRPGAEGVVGIQALLNLPPDGYTLLQTSSSTLVLGPVMTASLPYDPFKDLIPLVSVARSTMMLNLGPSTNFKSAGEFIRAARANPGKYTYASGTAAQRLGGELLQARAGIKLVNVPYKTTAAGATALAGGEVDMMLVDYSSVGTFWQGGRVRPLAVGGAARLKNFPNLPILEEEGVKGFNLTAWFALFFPRGTPAPMVAAMRDLLRTAVKSPAFAEAVSKAGMESMEFEGDAITSLIREEMDMWSGVMKAANVKTQ